MTRMSAEELEAFLYSHFPDTHTASFRVEEVGERFARLRLLYHDRHLRPGGTISGPSLMTLADTAMYVAVLAMIGPVALAVTTNLNINFLRKPSRSDVIAQARLLKLGKRLAVGDVTMYSDGDAEPVAHATLTYSIPADRETA
ncbi:MAG: PaaI family thioesterase [Blastocatellia bacterium]